MIGLITAHIPIIIPIFSSINELTKINSNYINHVTHFKFPRMARFILPANAMSIFTSHDWFQIHTQVSVGAGKNRQALCFRPTNVFNEMWNWIFTILSTSFIWVYSYDLPCNWSIPQWFPGKYLSTTKDRTLIPRFWWLRLQYSGVTDRAVILLDNDFILSAIFSNSPHRWLCRLFSTFLRRSMLEIVLSRVWRWSCRRVVSISLSESCLKKYVHHKVIWVFIVIQRCVFLRF